MIHCNYYLKFSLQSDLFLFKNLIAIFNQTEPFILLSQYNVLYIFVTI